MGGFQMSDLGQYPLRRGWSPLPSTPAAPKTETERQTNALEYIAYAFDRIEQNVTLQTKAAQESAKANGELVRLLIQIERHLSGH
jgi:hypothetical protein